MKILIANRGEIAVRVIRAAAELHLETVAVYSQDDAHSLHALLADECQPLTGSGPAAYLDGDEILAVAKERGCQAVHPGYGFLAENEAFARSVEQSGMVFIGPLADTLRLFGDKARSRKEAQSCSIPLLPATEGSTALEEAREFFDSLGEGEGMMIKALAGGGGRGMREVYDASELDSAFELCRSEAEAAFGSGDLYVERLIPRARHIEVQVIGDGSGEVAHLWERECTLQRSNQKLVEIAPSPSLDSDLRARLVQSALRLAEAAQYRSLGTFEFLVDTRARQQEEGFFFLEVNPRLQVEHPVTEEISGTDLVKAQLEIARGKDLAQLDLPGRDTEPPAGFAVELRVNMEEISESGTTVASSGTLNVFDPPLGPGIRVDTFGYTGYAINSRFDSLLAKLVCHSSSALFSDALAKASRALREFRIQGVATNIALLRSLLAHPDVLANRVYTGFLQDHLPELLEKQEEFRPVGDLAACLPGGQEEPEASPDQAMEGPEGTVAVFAPMPGTLVKLEVEEGDLVREGQAVAVVEAMKMQHLVDAGVSGVVRRLCVQPGEALASDRPLAFIEPAQVEASEVEEEEEVDLDRIRPDLAEVLERQRACRDEERPDAVQKRRQAGKRTARENIADLVDEDSFIEYGSLAVAAQRRRRSMQELMEKSPADGMVTGIGSVNRAAFPESEARCVVMAYDYTVMAGTQGAFNHAKCDRMLNLARQWRLPVVLFAEGGGGRPGDVDTAEMTAAGLYVDTFASYASLSGLVPVVGIVSGRCFAGNAVLLGCSDVIIATRDANIGMAGPAMIEEGGLGSCRPEDIGPVEDQAPNGVIDLLVEDEEEAVAAAKKYLSYFQGEVTDWDCADQRLLRRAVPENRLRAYNVREVIHTLADTGSVMELREQFGPGIVTALIRIEGRPMGLIANDCRHLGGAIDADSADKAARFMELCDAFDLPLLTLCDTPGFMVGPQAERSAQVRRFARMFTTAAGADIPVFSLVLRKGYGLGAQAMTGGGFHRPVFNVSWPSGEFGGMGLEGAVRLGYRRELEAVQDPKERQELFESLVAQAYEHGKASNMASYLEIDQVIDPQETRQWVSRGLRSMPPRAPRTGKKRPDIAPW